jgi:uncharacterized protein (UPF0332 family)
MEEAKLLIDNSFWNASVNRIYYACYYVVIALLLKKDIDTGTHKGVRMMFGLNFVQAGIVSKEDGRFFSDLFDRRQTGDYDDYVSFDQETVKKLFLQAEIFVNKIIELTRKLN